MSAPRIHLMNERVAARHRVACSGPFCGCGRCGSSGVGEPHGFDGEIPRGKRPTLISLRENTPDVITPAIQTGV